VIFPNPHGGSATVLRIAAIFGDESAVRGASGRRAERFSRDFHMSYPRLTCLWAKIYNDYAP